VRVDTKPTTLLASLTIRWCVVEKTKIRWCDSTWNVMTGCSRISPGCDNCYAESMMEGRFRNAFPNGFVPTFKANKLNQPDSWKTPQRVFVNSLSDIHHDDFTVEQVDAVYDKMVAVDRHDYLVLTKRPQRMAGYFNGADGWLARRNRTEVPSHIWLGCSIESDRYTFRADHLRKIPVTTRFISAEPLLGPLPSLNLDGIGWLIVGGESGNGTHNYRKMDMDWARHLRTLAEQTGTPLFYKQDSGTRTELRTQLDGTTIEQWPHPHPTTRTPTLFPT